MMQMCDIWYVLYVQGGKEKRLLSFLKEHDMQAFTPFIERLQKKEGKFSLVESPMFPNYIFVKSTLNQKEFNERLYVLRQLKKGIVKQLVHDYEGTSALQPKEQRLLECLMDETYTVRHSIGIIEGDAVIIIDGPLKGIESEILKIDRHKRIAYLGHEMLGKPIKISLEIVKKI